MDSKKNLLYMSFLSALDLKKFWVHAYVCLRYLPMRANNLLAKSRTMKIVALYQTCTKVKAVYCVS